MGVKIIKRRIMESYSISTAKMDSISANDFFSGIKEEIEENINPDLIYWKVVLVGQNNKRVYIEVEPLEISECNGMASDEICSTPYSALLMGEVDYDEKSYWNLQIKIREEYDNISRKIIPELAKDWGFRRT